MKTHLLFGIHCHQPVDNFDHVVHEIIEKSYEPFFKTLEQFPDFKCSVHFSGWLLEFIYQHRPCLFKRIQSLSEQLEFFTGGFYEPILASISKANRIAQIKMLSQFIQKHFKQTPQGLWLTERIWDDSIIDDLHECGIKYVVVDDYHLIASGHDANNLNGYFLTENSNHCMALFPINKALRYVIPFSSIEKTQQTLHEIANDEGRNAAIIFDDGEKFGVWPKTYEKVYEQKWLENFFQSTLEDESIEVMTFNEYYTKQHAISLAYLPTVSYHEMQEWSMLPNLAPTYDSLLNQLPHLEYMIRGGIWKNFFLKYQESNWIHKRSLELSKQNNKTAAYKKALFKTQCNDVLWHGIFGGIYLPNLRDNAYKYIIECENLLSMETNTQVLDINLNSYNEYKFLTPFLIVIIDCKNGGQIIELDLRESRFNLQNTLTRYHEIYHQKIQKVAHHEENGAKEEQSGTIHDAVLTTQEDLDFHVDWYIKKSAIDHISDNTFTIESFYNNSFKEYGDFANQVFDVKKHEALSLKLQRMGGIYDTQSFETQLEKSFTFDSKRIQTSINIATACDKKLFYIAEWNLHFSNYDMLIINEQRINEHLSFKASSIVIEDEVLNQTIRFDFKKQIQIYVVKIKTISQSEAGVDYTTQGLAFAFVVPLSEKFKFEYSFELV